LAKNKIYILIGAQMKQKCSICKYNEIGKFGHNAQPINDGRCCGWCNNEFVIPRRMQIMHTEMQKGKDEM